MRKLPGISQFVLVGVAAGVFVPFFISICLFGSTLQTFVAGAQPTAGYWSGAPTPVPTPPPGPLRTWTGNAFSAAGGLLLVAWSVVGAFLGEGLARRQSREALNPLPIAALGALLGSALFVGIALWGFLK